MALLNHLDLDISQFSHIIILNRRVTLFVILLRCPWAIPLNHLNDLWFLVSMTSNWLFNGLSKWHAQLITIWIGFTFWIFSIPIPLAISLAVSFTGSCTSLFAIQSVKLIWQPHLVLHGFLDQIILCSHLMLFGWASSFYLFTLVYFIIRGSDPFLKHFCISPVGLLGNDLILFGSLHKLCTSSLLVLYDFFNLLRYLWVLSYQIEVYPHSSWSGQRQSHSIKNTGETRDGFERFGIWTFSWHLQMIIALILLYIILLININLLMGYLIQVKAWYHRSLSTITWSIQIRFMRYWIWSLLHLFQGFQICATRLFLIEPWLIFPISTILTRSLNPLRFPGLNLWIWILIFIFVKVGFSQVLSISEMDLNYTGGGVQGSHNSCIRSILFEPTSIKSNQFMNSSDLLQRLWRQFLRLVIIVIHMPVFSRFLLAAWYGHLLMFGVIMALVFPLTSCIIQA